MLVTLLAGARVFKMTEQTNIELTLSYNLTGPRQLINIQYSSSKELRHCEILDLLTKPIE